jgi:hypothetical protein
MLLSASDSLSPFRELDQSLHEAVTGEIDTVMIRLESNLSIASSTGLDEA